MGRALEPLESRLWEELCHAASAENPRSSERVGKQIGARRKLADVNFIPPGCSGIAADALLLHVILYFFLFPHRSASLNLKASAKCTQLGCRGALGGAHVCKRE